MAFTAFASSEEQDQRGLDLRALCTSLTIEHALWMGLTSLALALRLFQLGGLPLQPTEATNALGSWHLLRGTGGGEIAGPLLTYGNALIFALVGANDASVRLIPALAGAALVGLPFLLRPWLGRAGALAAGLLLSLSPTALYFSRLVDDEGLAAAFGLGTVACVLHARTGRPAWLYAAAAMFGLLLLSGQDALTMILILATGAWLARSDARRALAGINPRRPALAAGAIVLLGSTALLANLSGLQDGIVAPLAAWLRLFAGAEQPWQLPLQILAYYEPLTLLFGCAGAIAALRSGDRLRRFLACWAVLALLVAARGGERPSSAILLGIVALALLAGPVSVRTLSDLRSSVPLRDLTVYVATMLSLLVLLWIAVQFFTLPGQTLPVSARFGPVILSVRGLSQIAIPFVIVVVAVGLVGMLLWIGTAHARGLLALLAVVALGLLTVRYAVLLNLSPYALPSELPVPARSSPDVRVLASDIGDAVDALSINRRPNSVRVLLPPANQAQWSPLAWYLREQPGVSYGARPAGDEAILVGPFGADPPPGRFAAQRYRLASSWNGEVADPSRQWRWLALREPPAPSQHDDVVLYLRMP